MSVYDIDQAGDVLCTYTASDLSTESIKTVRQLSFHTTNQLTDLIVAIFLYLGPPPPSP